MLQEATIQDGSSDKTTAQFTRMVAYDIASATTVRPTLVGEWVVPLPVSVFYHSSLQSALLTLAEYK